ncbi:MAG: TRAP transporter substrate-binding protein [Rectinema sp.]
MRSSKVFLFVLMLVVIMLLIPSAAFSQQPQYTFKLAGTGTKGIPFTDILYYGFKDKVEKYSNGRIKVDVYPGSALGGERETIEMLMQGTLEISMVSDQTYSTFEPRWGIKDLPYFISTRQEAWGFFDGEGGKKFTDFMLSKGIRILAFGENSLRQVSNSKREIHSPADLKGFKIRVPENRAMMDWFTSVGAIPTILPFPELFPAMQQKVVDGQENGIITMAFMNIADVQKYYSDTNHNYSCIPVAVNEKLWGSLPADLQSVLARAATEAVKEERENVLKVEKEAIEKLEKAGMKITILSPSERAKFVESAKSIWQKYSKQYGLDYMDWAFALVSKSWR